MENSVFHKVFDASDAGAVDVTANTLIINNHFFTTGEELTYTPTGGTTMSIGINTTSIVGFGTTDKLPSTVYAVRLQRTSLEMTVTSATDALLTYQIFLTSLRLVLGKLMRSHLRILTPRCW